MNKQIKRFLKKINIFRSKMFYDRGFSEMGKVIRYTLDENQRMAMHHVKRSNWVYNLCEHGKMFDGKA